MTIRCHWEDLLEHFDLQMCLGFRITAEQRMLHTKEYFSKFILGKASTPSSQQATNVSKFKCPQTRNKEESQSDARVIKRNLSKTNSGRDSSLTPNSKTKQDNTSGDRICSSEVGHYHRIHGQSDTDHRRANSLEGKTGLSLKLFLYQTLL